jgi:lysophospholipase L1-like esterase
MTLPVDESWPSRLERRLGVPVQNYGTAGFGPQQERLVLSDYVAQHRPRIVVLAFFAGNDIFDAEAFDEFERSGARRAVAGWRIKDVVSRADTWFLVSALRAGASWIGRQEALSVAAETLEPPAPAANGAPMTAAFDRGMFKVPAGDRELRCAFMPPYLNTLTFSQDVLAARSGWALTRRALAGMQRDTSAFGGTFVVMFLPFKSQVYFPLLRRAFVRDALQAAFQFYLGANPKAPDVDAMFRNRLAQNTLMRRFCEESRIPFLDLTDILQAHVESGENVYFPDESHLNEVGQTIVADALAAFLRRR